MSNWIDAMNTGMSVSSTAVDEATRSGSPKIDIDHLFAALTVSGGPAGEILRAHGVSLHSARAAIATVRERELGSLGITAPELEPLPKRPFGEANMDWTYRAQEALSAADGRYDGTGLLASLLAEPSGTIEQILRELDVDRDAVRADIQQSATHRPSAADLPEHHGRFLPTSAEEFAPAPVEEVWALASDPMRLPEWDISIQAVTAGEPGQWIGRQDRKKLRGGVVEGHQQVHIRLLTSEPDRHRVTYEHTWPNRPRSGGLRITVELEPVGNGTRVLVHSSIGRASGVRRVLQTATRPLGRVMVSAQAAYLATGLARQFR